VGPPSGRASPPARQSGCKRRQLLVFAPGGSDALADVAKAFAQFVFIQRERSGGHRPEVALRRADDPQAQLRTCVRERVTIKKGII
jgi:hypothetical protein